MICTLGDGIVPMVPGTVLAEGEGYLKDLDEAPGSYKDIEKVM